MVPDERDIQKANQIDRELARRVLAMCEWLGGYGFPIGIVAGYRTQYEQDRLYAQGRTLPGQIVTWTRNSNHTLGRAVDVGFRDGNRFVWNEVPAWWWDVIAWTAPRFGLGVPVKGDRGHLELSR